MRKKLMKKILSMVFLYHLNQSVNQSTGSIPSNMNNFVYLQDTFFSKAWDQGYMCFPEKLLRSAVLLNFSKIIKFLKF
jgi:hypothetical protein